MKKLLILFALLFAFDANAQATKGTVQRITGGSCSITDASVDTWLGASGTDTGVPTRASDGTYSLSASAGTIDESIGFTVDGGAVSPSVGKVGYYVIPYSGTIVGWSIISDQPGSAVFDIWKAASPNVPTVANTITASAKPTLSSAQKASSTTLTDWTTTVTAGDSFGYRLDSVSGVHWAALQITIRRD